MRCEKLYDFCYICGCVDHTVKDCVTVIRDNNGVKNYQYGPWLRAISDVGLGKRSSSQRKNSDGGKKKHITCWARSRGE